MQVRFVALLPIEFLLVPAIHAWGHSHGSPVILDVKSVGSSVPGGTKDLSIFSGSSAVPGGTMGVSVPERPKGKKGEGGSTKEGRSGVAGANEEGRGKKRMRGEGRGGEEKGRGGREKGEGEGREKGEGEGSGRREGEKNRRGRSRMNKWKHLTSENR